MKINAQVARDPEGYPTGSVTPTETVEDANKIIGEAGGDTLDRKVTDISPEGDLPPDDMVTEDASIDAATESKPQDRAQQVKSAIEDLSKHLNDISIAIYQMKLTDSQLQELTDKIVRSVSDTISDITVERVKDIAPNVLGSNE